MNRFLVIDQDPATAQRLGLRCLAEDIAVIIADNVCEGVRRLATTPVSLIVVDVGGLRLGVREHAALFDRVAPGVPVVVTVRADVPLETRVALELAGFRVLPKPVALDELLKTLVSAEV
jgi:DNA-binding response OmpR family regulator